MTLKTAQLLEFLNTRLGNIERKLESLENKVELSLSIQRNHLIRIKNGEQISDSNILLGTPYNDLRPQDAFNIYNDKNQDFFLLDVSEAGYCPNVKFEERIHIPLEDLPRKYAVLQNKTIPILIISEQGLRSIQACELLVKKGHFNINNISGGYQCWPTEKLKIAQGNI